MCTEKGDKFYNDLFIIILSLQNQELYTILSAIDNLSLVSKTTDITKCKEHSVNPVVVKLKQIEVSL